jgi:hypothetical protein
LNNILKSGSAPKRRIAPRIKEADRDRNLIPIKRVPQRTASFYSFIAELDVEALE